MHPKWTKICQIHDADKSKPVFCFQYIFNSTENIKKWEKKTVLKIWSHIFEEKKHEFWLKRTLTKKVLLQAM